MSDDQPRQAAASGDNEFSLSIDEVIERYTRAGLPRDRRTIQRYCASGKLDCRKIEIAYGDQYVITPASVDRHIAYIKEVRRPVASRDTPRLVAQELRAPSGSEGASANHGEPRLTAAHEFPEKTEPAHVAETTTGRDQPRPVAADDEMMSRYVARLEGENEFLRGQVGTKDEQIKELTERSRETNHLIAGFQQLFAPLLGSGSASPLGRDSHTSDLENRG
jgi:hypothetical protein